MKWMIASDLHGSALWCRRLFDLYRAEKADRMILLGDLLYHGPRNDLPEEYAPKQVMALLSEHREELMCVRGNCDGEVDQMVLPFPILAEYALLAEGNHTIFLTHGHHFHAGQLPPLKTGDILLHGHTHVPCNELTPAGIRVMNPGSVSMPKEGSWHGCMTLEGGLFRWLDLEGDEQLRYQLQP